MSHEPRLLAIPSLRSHSRVGARAFAILLAALLVTSTAAAATPVAVGYRDFSYGVSITRGSGDKPQSKLWYTDGRWWAGMFAPTPTTWWKIYRFDPASQDWTSTGTLTDDRDDSHGDYLWHEATQKLYIASAHPTSNLRIYRYSYNAATDAYAADDLNGAAAGNFVEIASGGTETATIARDSKGQLWAVWTTPDGLGRADVRLASSASDDDPATLTDEATWNPPVVLPSQGADRPAADDIAAVTAFGSGGAASIGVMYSKQNSGSDAMYFSVHGDSDADGTWSAKESANAGPEAADDHINLKVTADGRVLAATKTGKDGNPDPANDLILLLERSAAGTWTKHVVGTVENNQTRPQVVVDEELGAVYVFLAATESNDGGSIHYKSASFADLAAENAGGAAAFPRGAGTLLIQSATDPKINDVSTAKGAVTAASDLLVLASDRTTKLYFHNSLALDAADSTPPTGSVTVAGGAAATGSTSVSVATPATDAGSAVSRVEISNDASMSGSTLLPYTTPLSWTLPGGDGTKTVYVRWRDTVGNWSAIASDSISLDTVALPGTVSIAGGAAEVSGTAVQVSVSEPEPGNITAVRLSNTGTTTAGLLDGGTTFALAGSIPWNLASGADGARTVYAQWQDGLGHWSEVRSDDILLKTAGVVTPPGVISINGGADATRSTGVSVSLSKPADDVTHVRIGTDPSLAGAVWLPYSPTLAFTLSPGDGIKTIYAQWQDPDGMSAVASDSIRLDQTRPVVRPPRQAFALGTTGAVGLPGRVSWPFVEGGSGIRNFILQRSLNGRAYQTIGTPSENALSTAFRPGSSYRFRVRAVDRAGNASGWIYGPSFRAGAFQESSRSIIYSRGWRTASVVGAYGGKVKYARVTGTRATLRFVGRNIGLVTTKGPSRGSARIYINGVLAATVNLNSSTFQPRQLVYQRSFATSTTRTIQVRVLGTAGHPRVDLDAIVVLR